MSNITEGMGNKKLRIITYLVHGSSSLDVYETLRSYLEEALGMDTILMVESRTSGPPLGKVDPFTSDEADLGFLCSTTLLRHLQKKNEFMEFLPAAPIHVHPLSELRPIYYADVIVNKEEQKSKSYKEFEDLKGCVWAYNDEESVSGNFAALWKLKKMGTNANFFSSKIRTGSHIKSIKMVMNKTVDAATIDSVVMQQYFVEHPEYKEKIHVLESIGPLPIQPIVVNSRLPAELKEKLKETFLNMNKVPKWNKKLTKLGMWGFKESDISLYDKEVDLKEIVKEQQIQTAYY